MVKKKYSCTFFQLEIAIVTTLGERSVTELNLNCQNEEVRNIVFGRG